MAYLENEILNLPELMKYPLSSSFTQSREQTGGAPSKGDDITPSGERMRNR